MKNPIVKNHVMPSLGPSNLGPLSPFFLSPSSYSKLQPLLIDSPTVALHLLCPLVAQSITPKIQYGSKCEIVGDYVEK